MRILLIEDDKNLCDTLKYQLEREGILVDACTDGLDGLHYMKEDAHDMVLLDRMLPTMNGLQVLRRAREAQIKTPVIMITALGELYDKVEGLDSGADDYIVKPFDNKELVARVKAVLRRTETKETNVKKLVFPGLVINQSNYSVTYKDRNIDMPPKELELLFFLASHPNQVFTREQLLNQIWGYEYYGDTRTVDVHIKRIREKLDNDEHEEPWSIKTVWGVGYKFEVR